MSRAPRRLAALRASPRHPPRRPPVRRAPLLLLLAVASSLAMLAPALHALAIGDEATARAFGYTGMLFAVICGLIAIARSNVVAGRPAQSQLLVLLAAYVALPALLAVPFVEATGTAPLSAYAEMVSSLTTTGVSYFDPQLIVAPAHLWRAMVGWMGGLLIWVAAAAILAPMNLGGFEVGAFGEAGQGAARMEKVGTGADPAERVARFAADLAPIYAGLTLVLWMALVAAGDRPFVALCHAMATLSTSGISPIGGVSQARSGVVGEAVIAAFLVLALSRAAFMPGGTGGLRRAARDAELRLAALLVVATAGFLFLRHYIGAIDREGPGQFAAAASALWGGFFTSLGFLSTAGFESSYWQEARVWSGLEAPGPILMGLAMIGGGVATTAGGIKLFRIYAIAKHGLREMERLSHPSSVGGSGRRARRIRRQGARIAWIFFMLFALAVAAVTLALSATGIGFEHAMTLAVASLANTGPLAQTAPSVPVAPAELLPAAKLILSAAMVMGRLEMLAIVALLNPSLWRG